jgi:hypothetical protein
MTHPAAFDPAHVADGTTLPAYKPAAAVDAQPVVDQQQFAVVFDRPDPDRAYAWGPFRDADLAQRFAEFVQAEIDPARVTTLAEAMALPGVRLSDPVAELLAWRKSVALPQATPALCNVPHPVADHARCGLPAGHDGWHAADAGTWPRMELPFAARSTTAQEQQ